MNKNLTLLLTALLSASFALSVPAFAGVAATGEFTASQSCQAYQSIRKKTNPGNVTLEVGRSYPILELNVPDGTTWYLVNVDEATPQRRWVYFECGTADVTSRKEPSPGGKTGNCNTAGQGDSFVFAVSWQPAFCEGHRDKPECSVTDPDSYQAKNFTLHGLWPNKASCGTSYGFCGKYKKEMRPFCEFDPVPMAPETLEELGVVMPSAAYGSCLQRHEWYKHGTCQTEWNADQYFDSAMRLLKEFNDQGMSSFMTENLGQSVSTDAFFEKVDDLFGEGAHRRLQIACSGNDLVDVFINLPLNIPGDASLGDLLQQAPENFRNKCGSSFAVDRIDD